MRNLAMAAGLCLVAAGVIGAGGGGGKVSWVDYETGMATALKTGKPAMVYFTADW